MNIENDHVRVVERELPALFRYRFLNYSSQSARFSRTGGTDHSYVFVEELVTVDRNVDVLIRGQRCKAEPFCLRNCFIVNLPDVVDGRRLHDVDRQRFSLPPIRLVYDAFIAFYEELGVSALHDARHVLHSHAAF